MKSNLIKLLVFVLMFSTVAPSIGKASDIEENIESDSNTYFEENIVSDSNTYFEENIESINEAEIQPAILPAIPAVVAATVTAYLVRHTLKEAGEYFGKRVVVSLLGNGIKTYSAVWKGFKPYRGSIKTSGSGSKKRYYEWDNTHSDIEVYDKNGKHLGSMDPFDGEMYKPAVPGRTIKL